MIEIRNNEDGSLDEVVGHNVHVHLEQLDDNQWFLSLWEPSEKGPGWAPEGSLRVFFSTRRAHIKATVDDEREMNLGEHEVHRGE